MCNVGQCHILEDTETYCDRDSAPYVCMSTLPGQDDDDVKACNGDPNHWPQSGICAEPCDMRSCTSRISKLFIIFNERPIVFLTDGLDVSTNHQPFSFLYMSVPSFTNTLHPTHQPSLFLKITTNPLSLPFSQTTPNPHQPSIPPFFTDNHQHPPTLYPSLF